MLIANNGKHGIFCAVRAGSKEESAIAHVLQLFETARFDALIEADALTAIKLHVGERGNDSHLRPEHVRQVYRGLGHLVVTFTSR